MKNRWLFTALFLLNMFSGFSMDTLYISSGKDTIRNAAVWITAFTADSGLSIKNTPVIRTTPNVQKSVYIINLDTAQHNFTIPGVLEQGNDIAPGQGQQFDITLPEGVYSYFSSSNAARELGAYGMIVSGSWATFNWLLNEFDSTAALQAFTQESSIPFDANYRPNEFTINGLTHPESAADPAIEVTGNVNDTLFIAVCNAGKMHHTLHFHGYHVTIIHDVNGTMNDWIKDTIPFRPGDSMLLQLVPDKPGTFPVHDHNLISVTNNGIYPGGMITHLNIVP